MSYATATPAQQALVNNYTLQTRAVMIALQKLYNDCNGMMTNWNDVIFNIINPTTGATISDNTGIAGAAPLTDTNLSTLVGLMNSVVSTFGTTANQAVITTAIGPTNTFAS